MHIIEEEHMRAHRSATENKDQILERYYFPQLTNKIRKYIKQRDICNTSKYDRHPFKPQLQPKPIPTYPSEILHIDIMDIKDDKFITCVDKFSKFAKFFHIKDRSVLHLRGKITKILHYFTAPKILVMDNEGSFSSPIIGNYIKSLGIQIYRTPTGKSEVNGTVERVHSTILELVRCLQREYSDLSLKEIVEISVDRYNNTFHSVTRKKPAERYLLLSGGVIALIIKIWSILEIS